MYKIINVGFGFKRMHSELETVKALCRVLHPNIPSSIAYNVSHTY